MRQENEVVGTDLYRIVRFGDHPDFHQGDALSRVHAQLLCYLLFSHENGRDDIDLLIAGARIGRYNLLRTEEACRAKKGSRYKKIETHSNCFENNTSKLSDGMRPVGRET